MFVSLLSTVKMLLEFVVICEMGMSKARWFENRFLVKAFTRVESGISRTIASGVIVCLNLL